MDVPPEGISRGSRSSPRPRYSYPVEEIFPRPASNLSQTPGIPGKKQPNISVFSGILMFIRQETLDFPLSSMIQIVFPLRGIRGRDQMKPLFQVLKVSFVNFPTYFQIVTGDRDG